MALPLCPHRSSLAPRVLLALAIGACPIEQVSAAPSERDLAYEQGVQQQEAGDLLLAAASFERAYRLTPPAETGPRLLFLRASVAVRLRAFDGSVAATAHLCRARDLLRENLSEGAGDAAAGDPQAEERANLSRVEALLADAGGCGEGEAAEPTPEAAPAPEVGARPEVAPEGPAPAPASAPAPPPRPRGRSRTLLVAGSVSLGVGAASLAMMGGGIALARAASERGERLCRQQSDGCEASAAEIRDVVADGRLGDQLTRAGAALGGLGLLAGVVLLALHGRAPARVSLSPRLAPAEAGAAISGRF